MTTGDGGDTQAAQSLTGLVDGFLGYHRPTEADWREAYTSGLVVLDTNALLDFYRLSPAARSELLDLIERLRDRLFVPHHVAWEFHVRRVDAVADRREEFSNERQQLSTLSAQCLSLVNRVAQRAHGKNEDAAHAKAALSEAFGAAEGLLEKVISDYDLEADQISRGEDPVLAQLAALLQGRVGRAPGKDQLGQDEREGVRRGEAGVPPGHKDRKKRDNEFGDYLWWAEVLRHAKGGSSPVLLVTNDVAKGDWTYDKRGFRIGADPRLVAEMEEVAGRRLLLTTVPDLLAYAPRFFAQPDVSEATLAEARELPVGRSQAFTSHSQSLASRALDLADASGMAPPVKDYVGIGAGRIAVSMHDALAITGVHRWDLEHWVGQGLIEPAARRQKAWYFDFYSTVVICAARRLSDLGVSRRGLEDALFLLTAQEPLSGTLVTDGELSYIMDDVTEASEAIHRGMAGVALDRVVQQVRDAWPDTVIAN